MPQHGPEHPYRRGPRKPAQPPPTAVVRPALYHKIAALLAEQLGLDEDACTMDAHVNSDLGADSLDAVEIGIELEETLKVKTSDEFDEALDAWFTKDGTVAQLIAIVERATTH